MIVGIGFYIYIRCAAGLVKDVVLGKRNSD